MIKTYFKTASIGMFCVFLLAWFPLFNIKMVSVAIILFVVGALLNFDYQSYKKQKILKKESYMFFMYSALFFIYLISLLWTNDLRNGLKQLEKMLPFLFIPLSVFLLKPFKTKAQINLFYKYFIISNVVAVIVTISYLLYNIDVILNQKNSYVKNLKLREYIEDVPVIGKHTIYFSLLIAVALLLLYYNKFKLKTINVLFAITLLMGLFLASSRGVIIALFVVAGLIVFQKIKNKKKAILVFLTALSLFSATAYLSPLKTRFNEILENKYFYPEGVHFNSFNLRTAIYNCSFSLIKKTGFLGFSPGDTQKELNACYNKFNTDAFKIIKYNSHNQYLDYLLAFGFLGFSLILILFSFYLYAAIKHNNTLYFNFLILVYLIFLIENLLVRNTGIVTFVFFNCLFAYSCTNKTNIKVP